ncbi:MAG: hypothetical protein ACR2LU_07305 [Luteitalea sp.]
MRNRRLSARLSAACALLLLSGAPALAQYRPSAGDPATGESYHVEGAVGFWNPTPTIVFSSEQFGIPGTPIDLVDDLDVEKARFREFRLVLRPARKHKFRLSYTPIKYAADTVLRRTLVFNGIRYDVGLPVSAEFKWDAWRFGYEYDFIYRDRGFLGVVLDAKYTDVSAELNSPLASEFTSAKAPIPTIGLIGRGYLLPNLAITGEFSAFRIPESDSRDYSGKYYDFDLYGTLNFTNNVGVQVGYRRLTVGYTIDSDFGNLQLRGPYLMAVARF